MEGHGERNVTVLVANKNAGIIFSSWGLWKMTLFTLQNFRP